MYMGDVMGRGKVFAVDIRVVLVVLVWLVFIVDLSGNSSMPLTQLQV